MEKFCKKILKIFGGIFLSVIIFSAQIVSAEKTDWSDSSYNFKAVKTVVIFDADFPAAVESKGEIFRRKLADKYFEGAKKFKCTVLTEDQAKKIVAAQKNIDFNSMSEQNAKTILRKNLGGVADAWIESKIKLWQDDYYIIPAHTEWEEKKRTRRIRINSEWVEETYYVTVPVTYPPRRVDVSYLTSDFEVYDATSGKMIFGREDVRDREDAEAQVGMFGRMANSFFSDFAKKIK